VEVKFPRGELECTMTHFLNLYHPKISYAGLIWQMAKRAMWSSLCSLGSNWNIYAKSEKRRSSGGTVGI